MFGCQTTFTAARLVGPHRRVPDPRPVAPHRWRDVASRQPLRPAASRMIARHPPPHRLGQGRPDVHDQGQGGIGHPACRVRCGGVPGVKLRRILRHSRQAIRRKSLRCRHLQIPVRARYPPLRKPGVRADYVGLVRLCIRVQASGCVSPGGLTDGQTVTSGGRVPGRRGFWCGRQNSGCRNSDTGCGDWELIMIGVIPPPPKGCPLGKRAGTC